MKQEKPVQCQAIRKTRNAHVCWRTTLVAHTYQDALEIINRFLESETVFGLKNEIIYQPHWDLLELAKTYW